MRLLTEPLFASWQPPGERQYFLAANVGVFPTAANEQLVPDVFLSMDAAPKQPFEEKRNRSYFIWEHGKPPDIVVEVVSNTEGVELTRKLRGYERMRVAHYVVYDPWKLLQQEDMLIRFELHGNVLVQSSGLFFLPELDLGFTLWEGGFEETHATWLRWCRQGGVLIPTGAERAEQEHERAEQEHQRAEQEHQRAEQEHQRAEQEHQRAERLAAKLRELGIDPDAS